MFYNYKTLRLQNSVNGAPSGWDAAPPPCDGPPSGRDHPWDTWRLRRTTLWVG